MSCREVWTLKCFSFDLDTKGKNMNPLSRSGYVGLVVIALVALMVAPSMAWTVANSPYSANWARVDTRVDRSADPTFDLWYFYDGGAGHPNVIVDGGVNVCEGADGHYGVQLAWLEAGHGGWATGPVDFYLMGGAFFGEGSDGNWTLLSVAPEFYAYYVVSPWDVGNWTNVFLDTTGDNVPTVWWNRTYATLRAATDRLFVGPQLEWTVTFEKGSETGWLVGPRALVKVEPDRWHFELFGFRNNLTGDLGGRITLLAFVP